MRNYSILIAILLVLAGLGSGTIWLYDDPTFFSGFTSNTVPSSFEYQLGAVGSYEPLELSPFEIINSPIFPMLGHGFYINTSTVQRQNRTHVISLGSAGSGGIPPQITFSGDMENNLKYAGSKSSIRVGQGGSWTNLNTPWLI